MSIFAPVYRPTKHQQTLLVRQAKLQNRKRKRGSDSEDDEGLPADQLLEPGEVPRTASTAFHPVNKTDSYYVAGHARELPLPPPPFPHAAIPERKQPKRSIEEQLAELNPPLYLPPASEDKSTSLRRRHLDNLTTILHRCMLKGDWKRAFRAWGLIIRTEIQGRGIDVRRNGRWSIGAELLMREGGRKPETRVESRSDVRDPQTPNEREVEQSPFTEEGFKLARQYYERLILQYPHTARTAHLFNATAVYPALFNIWIYEVQDTAKRRRRAIEAISKEDFKNTEDVDANDDNETSSTTSQEFASARDFERREAVHAELEGATRIAQRMDELFLSPPYDTQSELLRLRGMVARWLSDLHSESTDLATADFVGEGIEQRVSGRGHTDIVGHRAKAEEEREKAVVMLEKAARSAGRSEVEV